MTTGKTKTKTVICTHCGEQFIMPFLDLRHVQADVLCVYCEEPTPV